MKHRREVIPIGRLCEPEGLNPSPGSSGVIELPGEVTAPDLTDNVPMIAQGVS
jgi:hypothetical protein